jgi:hypothetical protein
MKFGAKSVRLCGGVAALAMAACNQQTVPVTGPEAPFGPGQDVPEVTITGGLIDLGLTCLGFPSNAILADTPLSQFDPVVPVVAAEPAFMFFSAEENLGGAPGEITSFSILVQEGSGNGVAVLEFDVGANTNSVLTFGQYRLTGPNDPSGPSMTLTSPGAGGVCRSQVGDEVFIEDLEIDRTGGSAGRLERLRMSFLLNCGQGCVTFIDVNTTN